MNISKILETKKSILTFIRWKSQKKKREGEKIKENLSVWIQMRSDLKKEVLIMASEEPSIFL